MAGDVSMDPTESRQGRLAILHGLFRYIHVSGDGEPSAGDQWTHLASVRAVVPSILSPSLARVFRND